MILCNPSYIIKATDSEGSLLVRLVTIQYISVQDYT